MRHRTLMLVVVLTLLGPALAVHGQTETPPEDTGSSADPAAATEPGAAPPAAAADGARTENGTENAGGEAEAGDEENTEEDGSSTGSGAAGGATTTIKLFRWYDEKDWSTGGFLALLGLVGALVTVFSVIGGAVPGTEGAAWIDLNRARIDDWYEKFESLLAAKPAESESVRELADAIDKLRDDVRSERWRQFWVAAVLYAVLGAFFGAALAADPVQALVIGAGWTGFVGAFGLKGDFQARKKVKDEAIADVKELAGAPGAGKEGESAETKGDEGISPERQRVFNMANRAMKL